MWDKKSITDPFSGISLAQKILIMALVVVLVLAVVALVVFRDELRLEATVRRIRYWGMSDCQVDGHFSYDVHNSNRYAGFDNGLAVASVGGLYIYDMDGREIVVSQGQINLPQVCAGKEMVMAYDAGGNTLLAVHGSNGEVLRVTSEKPILDADLSTEGDIAYVSSETGCKSVLTVYNEKQELVYRWLSTSTYMPVCAVSPNGENLAAIGLDEQDGAFVSTLNLFRTDKDQMLSTTVLGSDLVYDLEYLDPDLLCAVGESGISFVSGAGEVTGTYSYDSGYLKDFDTGGDGFLALSMNTYRAGNRYTLVLVDESGAELGSVYIGREILDISAAGKYVAVLTSHGLKIYDRKLNLYAETDDVGSATAVIMQSDGVSILLGAGTGRYFIP